MDRCPHPRKNAFAQAFLAPFADGDPELRTAIDESDVVGSRTQLTLPARAATGPLFPDLSVEGSRRSFQLLVEVEVGSDFHEYQVDGDVLLQPEHELSSAAERHYGAVTAQVP